MRTIPQSLAVNILSRAGRAFDLLAERPARAELTAFKRNKEALCQAERILRPSK